MKAITKKTMTSILVSAVIFLLLGLPASAQET